MTTTEHVKPMKSRTRVGLPALSFACATLTLAASGLVAGAGTAPSVEDGPIWFYPPIEGVMPPRTRSLERSTLAPELLALYEQFEIDDSPTIFSPNELRHRFGIDPDDDEPSVTVLVRLADGFDADSFEMAGFQRTSRFGDVVVGIVPVTMLPRLALSPAAESVQPVTVTPRPTPIASVQLLEPAQPERSLLPPDFGVRGDGVIIGVIDTGIDFTHPDFIDEHGLSRILGIYDIYDDSWTTSQGAIGTEPPQFVGAGIPRGTVYTQFQINEALMGRGTVNHRDTDGHGTNVAGLAAGSGRGVARGVDSSVGLKYRGVAPNADLLIVRAQDGSNFPNAAMIAGIDWIVAEAKIRNRPVVINMSLGGQGTTKDGTMDVEMVIDRITGPGKPGVAFVIAAGNEGRQNLHAGTRFGPNRPGELGAKGEWVQVTADGEAVLNVIFKDADNFGLGIQGIATAPNAPLVAEDGQPQAVFLNNPRGRELVSGRSANLTDERMHQFFRTQMLAPTINQATGEVLIQFLLQPGRYLVWGFGAGPEVPHGAVSFYLPRHTISSFGTGTIKSEMVGSPGNARHGITVASYDFRSRWQGVGGSWVGYAVPGGALSDYSNPGFRRDGVIKPDITAPGRWSISARSSHADTPKELIADSGMHSAWQGTSASSPYVAGVVALMFQHNPTLDVEQIREILIDTAIEDQSTGAVPNRGWGHGKINPAMAISRAQSSRPRTGATGAP